MTKISTKLWILMLILIGVTLMLLWFFQIEFLDKYYINKQVGNVIHEGNILSEMISKDDMENAWNKIDEMLLKYPLRIEVIDSQGRIIISEGAQLMRGRQGHMGGFERNGIYREIMKEGEIIKRDISSIMGITIISIGVPIKVEKSTIGALILYLPMAPISNTIEILKNQLVLITVILIAVSALLSFFFSRIFSKPILDINDAAIKMASGNLSVKVNVKSKDELGVLAASINNLSTQLQKYDQLRKELIANVSHEFRTPLSLIKGYAETIRDVTGDNREKRNRQLNIILEESDRLSNMVDELIELSQIQSDYFKLEVESFEIDNAIERVVSRFKYIVLSQGKEIFFTNTEKIKYAKGDEKRIEQVLYNLINNAFIHTKQGGEIRIRLQKEATDRVRVFVSDNGNGIPENEIQYIWDKFYKAGKDRNAQSGSGLGLAIVKGILDAHKTQYGINSKEGEGTTIWFDLNA